jgi:histidine triad (HIT) family protein
MTKAGGGAASKGCVFCSIARGATAAHVVLEDELLLAFLDHRPLLPGHCLLVPKLHVPTLADLPGGLIAPLFGGVKLLARAVEEGMEADGSFTAINVKISQSVPHLHVHVVPRWKGDGLFSYKLLWKRSPYKDDAARAAVHAKLRRAVARLMEETSATSSG